MKSLNLSMNNRLSRNELRFKIKSKEYERLPEKTRNKLIKKEETNLEDFVKNPIVLKSKNKYKFLTEKNLQDIIMEDIHIGEKGGTGGVITKTIIKRKTIMIEKMKIIQII